MRPSGRSPPPSAPGAVVGDGRQQPPAPPERLEPLLQPGGPAVARDPQPGGERLLGERPVSVEEAALGFAQARIGLLEPEAERPPALGDGGPVRRGSGAVSPRRLGVARIPVGERLEGWGTAPRLRLEQALDPVAERARAGRRLLGGRVVTRRPGTFGDHRFGTGAERVQAGCEAHLLGAGSRLERALDQQARRVRTSAQQLELDPGAGQRLDPGGPARVRHRLIRRGDQEPGLGRPLALHLDSSARGAQLDLGECQAPAHAQWR